MITASYSAYAYTDIYLCFRYLIFRLGFIFSRLKTRVLAVKNMFLNDRLNAMEEEMEMMERESRPPMRMPVRMPAPPTSSIRESPILRALKGMRVE